MGRTRTSFATMQCSLARGLDLIGDWWSPLIIRDVYLGVVRFDDLAADLGISRNLLATRLDALVERGVLERVQYSERPQRFEYALTEKGRDLVPVIVALTAWGDKWARPDEGSPIVFRHKSCGHVITPSIV